MRHHQGSFVALTQDFGVDRISDAIKLLLEKRVFESELNAKVEFPELYQTSPARNIQHTESENDAARSEAEALEDLSSPSALQRHVAQETAATEAPSLYPLRLPYSIQHIILTAVQRQLEECCYDFMTKWRPSLLAEKEWDCAEAVELTEWVKILPSVCEELPTDAVLNNTGLLLKEILSPVSTIRHSAVHRLSTGGRGVQRMIQSALTLTMVLGDFSRAAELEALENEMECRIKDMQLNKNFLENRLDEQLQEICKMRKDLDRKEEEAITTMLREDKENRLLIGNLLENTVRGGFGFDKKSKATAGEDDDRLQTDHEESDELELKKGTDEVFITVEEADAEVGSSSATWMRK